MVPSTVSDQLRQGNVSSFGKDVETMFGEDLRMEDHSTLISSVLVMLSAGTAMAVCNWYLKEQRRRQQEGRPFGTGWVWVLAVVEVCSAIGPAVYG